MSSKDIWVKTNEAVPRFVVQMLPVDDKRRCLVMHRSNNVRSARNVWSFPSGLQDIGEHWPEACSRELREEYGLDAQRLLISGIYENIAGDDENYDKPQWHWVILVVAVKVADVTQAINREPEKHDKMEFIDFETLLEDNFTSEYPFHKSFIQFFKTNRYGIVNKLEEVIQCDTQE